MFVNLAYGDNGKDDDAPADGDEGENSTEDFADEMKT